jgi:hypothetical protein
MTGTSDRDPIQVCVLFDETSMMRWVGDAIEHMLRETNTEISLVVINEDAGLFGSGNIKRGKKYPAYALFWLARNQLLSRTENQDRYDDQIPISEIEAVADAEWIHCQPINDGGLWNTLPSEVVDQVGSSSDLVVRRGFGLIEGDILTATKYGVLSYHHGDPRKYRGGPAGFWEYMHGEDNVGMMVQTLRPELDAGTILAYDEVNISDCTTWDAVRQRVYPKSTTLLATAVDRIQREANPAISPDSFGKVYHPPSAVDISKYLLKTLWDA